jgi:hypothetical protein
MSGANFGARRNLLYANLSIPTFIVAAKIITVSKHMRNTPHAAGPEESLWNQIVMKLAEKTALSIKRSPCAKLISSIIPYTNVYPKAISA